MTSQDNSSLQRKPVRILSDKPVNKKAVFGFDAYIKTITDLIAFNENETPLTIGVYGSWGSGKTTLMKSVKQSLDTDQRYKNDKDYRKCKTMWFQPWKYNNEEEILSALIEEIFLTMEKDSLFSKGKLELQKVVKKLDGIKIFESIVKGITGVKINDIFQELPHKSKLGFYDVFQDFFKDLIWTYLSWRPQLNKFEKTDDKKGAFVIFIDDLDRCPKDKIVSVLESIKLFMDIEGCIFVLGAANEIIIKALRDIYKEDADSFMDKIVQVTFNLPKIPSDEFDLFLEDFEGYETKEIKEYLTVLIPALDNNPRSLKRFINNLSLQESIIINKGLDIKKEKLILWQIIEYRYSSFVTGAKGNEYGNIETILKVIDMYKDNYGAENLSDFSEKMAEQIEKYDPLKEYFNDSQFLAIIDKFRCSKDELEQMITLTGMVESSEDVKRKIVEKKSRSLDSMVHIPKGKFLYGDKKESEMINQDYEIDKYPVTNSRFEKFIRAGGYSNKEYWDDESWEFKESENIIQPKYLSNFDFNDPEEPIVGVSFYEAEAFCKWLTKNSNGKYEYRLPSEKEWEKAARGDKGWEYPWGEGFDKEKCNTKESEIGRTTRVSVYHNGISQYGCYDMAGNVWEWTSSYYDNDKDRFVLRGGSFYDNSVGCRCAYRYYYLPNERNIGLGFRCSRIKLDFLPFVSVSENQI
ncbi:MAG: SUMF1/EgtB/PvdO family nonheme iron enzyme [Desulfobacteraceae bacterium]|nr:SUMF1/EgtB/PvdO family nonheme iron enzyme [Desulfobacteraceae bacterium]